MYKPTHKRRFTLLASVALYLLIWLVTFVLNTELARAQAAATPLEFKELAILKDSKINESSGLIVSKRNPDCFWTHNDSGDSPQLFLIHRDGRTIARVKVEGAIAIDWEDITMATINGAPMIIVGDIGGNAQKRNHVTLYVISEPRFQSDDKNAVSNVESSASVEATIDVTFAGGVTNYEGIAVDQESNSIVILEKALLGARLYSLPLPSLSKKKLKVEASEIGQTSVPFACACDISNDSRSMVVTTYFVGFLFTRRTKENGSLENWSETFLREPISFALPKLRQPEAVCFSADAKSIFLTSEQLPTPLVEMKLPSALK